MRLDPVMLEILGNKLTAATEEMGLTLQRVGRTLYVKETADFCCALAGLDGRFFAYPRSIGVSGFVGLDCLPAIAAVGELAPGDVILTNDPYRSRGLATHLPDLHVIAPCFHEGRIVAYAWAFLHCSDVGGRVPSSISPTNSEIFQEGLQIPPLRLVRGGAIVPEVELLFRANSRTPDANMGDIRAMLAALEVGRARIARIIAQHGAEALLAAQQDLPDYAERRARAVLAALPEGEFRFVDYLDSDVVSDLPVRLAVALRLAGGGIEIDFTGTDPQLAAAMNIPSVGQVHPWLTLRVMALVATRDPGVPLNAGLQRPIRMIAPEGTVVNPLPPAAVGVRHAACVRVNDLLNGALGLAAPEVMTAANSGMIVPVVVAEPDGQGGRNVQVVEPMTGGTGARRGADGTDGRDPSISNLANNPVETVEAELALEVERYALRADSAGPGEWRGGCGLELVFRIGAEGSLVLARGMERALFRPWGTAGGGPGAAAEFTVLREGALDETLRRVDMLELRAGDRIRLRTAGAGGYGEPFRRDPAAVLHDLRQGLVSPEAAERDYGVVLREGVPDLEADLEATAARRARGGATAPWGSAREAWEAVFTGAAMARLSAALAALPLARRQPVRRALYAAVLAHLPADFPAAPAPAVALEAARRALATQLDHIAPEGG
ncbi:hydantoinase B/oxoprolinase family protein [Roseomonas sp. GC11]|uniref:hydantoinase B/oxoprolinase family protein n=1 Tax=Roseomonas sp. GC11 TaxID=2950546 RepID=UPI00210CEB85|nr:hydantoinase B/oxoprolinase family protein [Roseomonas sp. GC11]MCQ4160320.1 hydantoinase B/oxoprolinase family protein [Roseomonas sp. GC11]